MIKVQTKHKLIRGIGLILTLFTFFQQGFSTTYYSKGGSWNDAMSWVTGSCASTTNAGTYPISGDTAVICGGNTIIIEGNMTCQKVDVIDGTISYSTTGGSSLYVQGGNLSVKKAGKIEYTGNSTLKHNLFIDGYLLNEGQLNLRSDADDYVLISFTGSIPSKIPALGGSYQLGYLRMNKNIPNILVDNQDPIFTKALTVGSMMVGHSSLDLNRGIFRHNNTEEMGNVYQPGMTLNDPMVIPENVTIEVFQGKVTIPINNITYLRGKIRLAGGTLAVSTGIGALTPYGLYYQGNTAAITLQNGGVLYIPGVFKNDPTVPSSIIFYMAGDSRVDVGIVKSTVEVFKITELSTFHMSWGVITLHNQSNYRDLSVVMPTDFELMGRTQVTGGKIEFGGLYTVGAQNFRFTGCKQFPHIVINSNVLFPITVNPYTHPCQFSSLYGWKFDVLSLTIGRGKTFDMKDIRTFSDHTTMTIAYANDSLGFHNDGTFNARSSWVDFSGRYQRISGKSITVFSSLRVNLDPFKPFDNDVWTGPILKTNIVVADTTLLFRNLDLNQKELKTGLSDSKPGYMSVNLNCGVFHGTLTRYFTKNKKLLDFFSDKLNDYTSSDLPFYITDLQTINTLSCPGVYYHLDRNNASRTVLIAAERIPQLGGYISVTYKGYHESGSGKIGLSRCNYIDGGDQVNVIAGFHWTISAEAKLATGSYVIAAKNLSLTLDNPDVQNLRLLQWTGDAISGVGVKGFNPGVAPLISSRYPYHIFGKPCYFYTAKPGYAALTYVTRYSLSYTDLNNSFYIGTLVGANPSTYYEQASSLAFRYENGKDPYPFPTLKGELEEDEIMLSSLSDELFIYPNPAHRGEGMVITISSKISGKAFSVQLINMHGDVIANTTTDLDSSKKLIMDLSKYNIKEGMYMLLISQGDRIWQKRLLIK